MTRSAIGIRDTLCGYGDPHRETPEERAERARKIGEVVLAMRWDGVLGIGVDATEGVSFDGCETDTETSEAVGGCAVGLLWSTARYADQLADLERIGGDFYEFVDSVIWNAGELGAAAGRVFQDGPRPEGREVSVADVYRVVAAMTKIKLTEPLPAA